MQRGCSGNPFSVTLNLAALESVDRFISSQSERLTIMFCPQCGQERISQATSFCSRCGFLLTVTSELLPTGGVLPQSLLPPPPAGPSPRARGIRMGLFMFLLTFLVAPLFGIISTFALGIRPWPAGIAVLFLGVGGLLRMAYALMFEAGAAPLLPPHVVRPGTGALPTADNRQLTADPNSQFIPAAGHWRDTRDLEPASVTEHTTKLLEKESDPPA
jgi:hypothetical protein